ncbi:hypothetical protein BLNAU_13264 [Blattamonas nauphoetae]|uniref:Uncharacterized protein n=1 Tax=Blattamonas nauphoetae TaxID=2049346 RepID=A0ABQ9XH39_9EUKA|nr:hypothetical protein BLNAU_13264 [Blattamonas nauphoetae]
MGCKQSQLPLNKEPETAREDIAGQKTRTDKTITKPSSYDYSRFLMWNPNYPATVDSLALVFNSLASIVRDDFQLDKEQFHKASTLLSLIKPIVNRESDFDAFSKAIGQGSSNTAAVFVDFMTVLLSLSHSSLFGDTLNFVYQYIDGRSESSRLTLFSSKLIPRLLSVPQLQDLSVIEDQDILFSVLLILDNGARLATDFHIQSVLAEVRSMVDMLPQVNAANPLIDRPNLRTRFTDTDPDIIRDVMLNDVFIPMEPSLVQITRNRVLKSRHNPFETILQIRFHMLKNCAFHQPTLDFVCSSSVPMVFVSLLTESRLDYTPHFVISSLSHEITFWEEDGAETVGRGKILLQTLEREGFLEEIEKQVVYEILSTRGRDTTLHTLHIMNFLGMNASRPQ